MLPSMKNLLLVVMGCFLGIAESSVPQPIPVPGYGSVPVPAPVAEPVPQPTFLPTSAVETLQPTLAPTYSPTELATEAPPAEETEAEAEDEGEKEDEEEEEEDGTPSPVPVPGPQGQEVPAPSPSKQTDAPTVQSPPTEVFRTEQSVTYFGADETRFIKLCNVNADGDNVIITIEVHAVYDICVEKDSTDGTNSSCIIEYPSGEGNSQSEIEVEAFSVERSEELCELEGDLGEVDYIVASVVNFQVTQGNGDGVQHYEIAMGIEVDYSETGCAAGDIRVDNGLSCGLYDEKEGSWDRDACEVAEVHENATSVVCACDKTGVLSVIQNTQTLKDNCAWSQVLGNKLFLVFTVIYGLILLFALIQTRDLVRLYGFTRDINFVVHILLITIGIYNIIIGSVVLDADPAEPLKANILILAVIWAASYTMTFWAYGCVVFAWANICYEPLGKKPPELLKRALIVTISIQAVMMLGLFIGTGAGSGQGLQTWLFVGTGVIAALSLILAGGFIVYGGFLVKRLWESRNLNPNASTFTPLIRRTSVIMLCLTVIFVVQSAFPIISGFNRAQFFANFTAFQSVYLVLDVLILTTVLILFYQVVKDETISRQNRQRPDDLLQERQSQGSRVTEMTHI